MIARRIKQALQSAALTGRAYVLARDSYHRLRKLRLHGRDALQTWRDMRWQGAAQDQYWVLSAELLFQYHKLEKGLSMPGPKRFFGYDPATATLDLIDRWQAAGLPRDWRIYQGAIATLLAYRQRLDLTPPTQGAKLIARLDALLAQCGPTLAELSTPLAARSVCGQADEAALARLLLARRSVRNFADRPVDSALIKQAVQMAQLSPSACNRQPWRVHVYEQRGQIDALLALQDGNRGFGHTIPVLLLLCSDARCFFDASERHEPYVDGGLFAMSLILALQSLGLSSCCLNWCVEADKDEAAHRAGGLEPAERIVMFVAVGHAADDALVPRSPRRPLDDVLRFHEPRQAKDR